MKIIISFATLFMLSIISCYAQHVDSFEVGPYEVEYKGSGDYRFRIRKGIDLYDYFDLKKDTIIEIKQPLSQSLQNAWQIGAELTRRLWGFGFEATQASVFGQYKLGIADCLYLNGGLSLGYQYNRCFPEIVPGLDEIHAEIFELGVPLSIEYADLRINSSTFFVLGGLSPVFSTTVSQKERGKNQSLGKNTGFRVDPRIEFGVYTPFSTVMGRIGLFIQKGFCLSESNPSGLDLHYSDRTTRVSIGANVSVLF